MGDAARVSVTTKAAAAVTPTPSDASTAGDDHPRVGPSIRA